MPGIDRLSLLPAGPVPSNPAELLGSPRARDIFTRLRDQYDLVLIDSPPVLPVTDAAILSRYADATLMLAAAGQTRRADLHRAVEKLDQGGTTILGTVLNKVTRQTGQYYGYTYAYKAYRAGRRRRGGSTSEREQRYEKSQPTLITTSAALHLPRRIPGLGNPGPAH